MTILIQVWASPEDSEIINKVDSMNNTTLNYYSEHFVVIDLKHYMKLQIKWMEEERYFLGTRVHHNPTDEELIEDWILHKNPQRFRAFYVLKYPEKVEEND